MEFYQRLLSGYHRFDFRETGSKESRAKPVSAKAERNKIKLLRGPWNEKFITQAINFPAGQKDIIDAMSGAFAYFVERGVVQEYPVNNNVMERQAKGIHAISQNKKYQF